MLETCLAVLLATLQDPILESRTSKWTGITVDFDYWMAGARGSTEAGEPTSNPGGSLDLSDDLKIRSGSVATFGLQYAWPRDSSVREYALRFEYQRGSWSGRGVLQEEIEFDDKVFPSGTRVSSRLRFDNCRLEFSGSASLDGRGVVHLMFGTGLNVIYGAQSLEGTGRSKSTLYGDLQVGLQAGVKVQPWKFAYAQFVLEGYGGPLSALSWETRAWVGGQWGPVRAEVGYRLQQHSQWGDQLRLQGVFFGVAGDF